VGPVTQNAQRPTVLHWWHGMTETTWVRHHETFTCLSSRSISRSWSTVSKAAVRSAASNFHHSGLCAVKWTVCWLWVWHQIINCPRKTAAGSGLPFPVTWKGMVSLKQACSYMKLDCVWSVCSVAHLHCLSELKTLWLMSLTCTVTLTSSSLTNIQ